MAATAAILLVCLSFAVAGRAEQVDCKDLGFDKEVVACSDCATLEQLTKDAALAQECRQCCVSEVKRMYKSAVLEVCPQRLAYMTDIKAFVEKHAEQIPGLKLSYVVHASPKLKLTPVDDSKLEVMRIEGFKTAQLVELLEAQLVKPEGGADEA